MKSFSPFSHRRDESLGEVLRQLLTPSDHATFVEQVMGRAAGEPVGADTEVWWDVLGSWARPGLAAAAILAALGVLAFTQVPQPGISVALEDTLSEVPDQDERTSFLLANDPPDFDVILASGVVRPDNR